MAAWQKAVPLEGKGVGAIREVSEILKSSSTPNFNKTQCGNTAGRPVKGALHSCWMHQKKPNVCCQAQRGEPEK